MNYEKKERQPAAAGLVNSLILICLLVLLYPQKVLAQETFKLNGRDINIDQLNSQIITMLADLDIPGFSVAVLDEGKIVFNEVYGLRKQTLKKKVNKRTVFEGCSLSKTLLVFAVHQLVDKGELDLDRPLYQYRKNPQLSYDSRYKSITARMVLSHSSGLENWRSHNNQDTLEIMHDPGKAYLYSGEGYNYLADVMETITGQSHEEYMDELVIKQLKLKNTYLKFEQKRFNPFVKMTPANYASGHNVFNRVYRKWQNRSPIPASAVNLTTEDYAKLVLAFFDDKHLSQERVKDILTPTVRQNPEDPSSHGGPGFSVLYAGADSLISQWGANGGYKAEFIYSVVSNSGFVFFSNHDRGWAVASYLNQLTTQFDKSLFEDYGAFGEYYPSVVTDLLKTYKQEGGENLISHLTDLHKNNGITARQLNEFSREISSRDYDLSREILELNQRLNPDSPDAYGLLGEMYFDDNDYPQALKLLVKADKLGFDKWSLEEMIAQCREDAQKRVFTCANPVLLTAGKQTIIEAEDYCIMQGFGTRNTHDEGGGLLMGGTEPGKWLEYKIKVERAGTYAVKLRMASPRGEGKLTLHVNNGPGVTVMNFQNTTSWDLYAINEAAIKLPEGVHSLKLQVQEGGWNINWLGFEAISASGSH